MTYLLMIYFLQLWQAELKDFIGHLRPIGRSFLTPGTDVCGVFSCVQNTRATSPTDTGKKK